MSATARKNSHLPRENYLDEAEVGRMLLGIFSECADEPEVKAHVFRSPEGKVGLEFVDDKGRHVFVEEWDSFDELLFSFFGPEDGDGQ